MKIGKEIKQKFWELCEIEPEFKKLYEECKSFVPPERKPITEGKLNGYWHQRFKPRMEDLVDRADVEAGKRGFVAHVVASSMLWETLYNRWKQYCFLTWDRRERWNSERKG